jgi:antitoxin YefM
MTVALYDRLTADRDCRKFVQAGAVGLEVAEPLIQHPHPGMVPFLVLTRSEIMAITASEARRGLFPLIEKVNDDRSAIEITSKRGNAVLISADDYAAWQETAYLFRSPANARRLLDAADAAERGELTEQRLDRE